MTVNYTRSILSWNVKTEIGTKVETGQEWLSLFKNVESIGQKKTLARNIDNHVKKSNNFWILTSA